MKTQPIIIGLIASVAIVYFIWTKFKNKRPQSGTYASVSSAKLLPAKEK